MWEILEAFQQARDKSLQTFFPATSQAHKPSKKMYELQHEIDQGHKS